MPRAEPALVLEDHELVLLAALIADGNLTQSTPRFCFGPNSPVLSEVEAAAATMGLRLQTSAYGHGTATISAGRGGPRNPLTALLPPHGSVGPQLEGEVRP